MIKETFKQAVQNVLSNKVRTFLTMLGIIIGVMAVIVIVGLGNGMTHMMQDFYSDMGSDILAVNIMTASTRTVEVSDVYKRQHHRLSGCAHPRPVSAGRQRCRQDEPP